MAAIVAAPWWMKQATYELVSKKLWWWRGGIFAASVSVPFLLFCLLTEQNIVEIFQHVATFGGATIEYVEREYNIYDAFYNLTYSSDGYRILIPF